MATIKVKTTASAVPASLGYGELGIAANELYFGNASSTPVRVAKATEIPTVNNGTLTLNVSGSGLSGSQTFTANQSGNATFTVASNATTAGTVSTLVYRDAAGKITAGTDGFNTGSVQMKYNTTTLSLDFIFVQNGDVEGNFLID